MTRNVDIDFAALAERLRASTVRVHDANGRGSGSGVVWRDDGTIVTNAHVVRTKAATVEFEGGRRERAELVRRDDARDLATLRIGGEGNVALAAREARSLQPGELVVAVGNPLGLVGAMTAGIVQRSNARWVVADVRLAPGNSGGPLADVAGKVVGINSMVVGGLAFAVPSESVMAFLDGRARRRLGVALAPALARTANGPVRVLVITEVEHGSVAEGSGLALGDAIVGTDRGTLAQRGGFDDAQAIATTLSESSSLAIVRAGVRREVRLAWAEDARAA